MATVASIMQGRKPNADGRVSQGGNAGWRRLAATERDQATRQLAASALRGRLWIRVIRQLPGYPGCGACCSSGADSPPRGSR